MINKLPEKWCIKRTRETWDIITDYFNDTFGNTYLDDNWDYPYVHYTGNSTNESSSYVYNNYTEISFEDFKRLVLKENNELIYEIW